MFWFWKKKEVVITDEKLIKINELTNAAGVLRVHLSNQIRNILGEEKYGYQKKVYYTYQSAHTAFMEHYKQIIINHSIIKAFSIDKSVLDTTHLTTDDDIYKDIIRIADSLGMQI